MDWFDRQILQYVLWWAPFGPPPDDDVFPKFGLDSCQLATRVTDILKDLTRREHQLNLADTALLARARSHHLVADKQPRRPFAGDDALQ